MVAGLFVAGLFVASWFFSGNQVARAFAAFGAVASLMIMVELTAATGRRLANRKRWCISRTRMSRTLLLRRLLPVLLHALILSTALLTLLQTQHPHSTGMKLWRLAAGVAFLYAAAALVFDLSALGFVTAGFSLPVMHRNPIAARSVGEFWGQRWNIIVSAWLRTFIFWPLARGGTAGIAVLCCFLISGIFHGWPMLVALGTSAAASTVLFFVIQGVLVLVEARLHIHAWPVALARAWTLVTLLASSPLFIDPGLRLFGY